MGHKKRERTLLLENQVKTQVIDSMIAEEIQQIKFDNLIKRGIIRIDYANSDTETTDRGLPDHIRNATRQASV